ncbi:MAG: 6-bladed beta-propeller [Bacteroidetes bacterium]|nr:6-bladed beta-propeller [Bacteroidota bacterium]
MIFLSCSSQKDHDEEQSDSGVLHPTEENIPVITDSRFLLHEEKPAEAKPFLDISGGNGHLIGIMEGPSAEMIGDIADVTISKEALYYADSEYGEVRIYDQFGSLMSTVGSPGPGPGEFQQPYKLSVTDDGEILAVLDQGTRVQVFRQQDSTYTLGYTFRVPDSFYGGDICVMNDHVYTLGLSVSEELDGIIHKYTISGEYVTSFGAIYKTSFELLRRMLAPEGSLGCNEKHSVVGHVNDNIPVLTGYTDTGSLMWQVKFADLNPAKIEEGVTSEGAPSVTRREPKKGDSGGILLLSNTEDSFLFTYDTIFDFDSLTEAPSGTRHYFNVDVQTGQGSYLGQNADIDLYEYPILVALDAERAYTMAFNPFPQFGIYPRKEVLP